MFISINVGTGDAYHTMPMQLTNRSLLEMLLSSRNVLTSREVIDDLFANPAARIDLGFGVAEAPFKVRYGP